MPVKNNLSNFKTLKEFFANHQAKIPDRIYNSELEVYNSVKDEDSLRNAAVLIPITRDTNDINSHVILTVRSPNLKSHAGQISLPGGTREDLDADDIATALRESEEEIGLSPSAVEIIGRLGSLALPSGFLVKPIVGVVDQGLIYNPQQEEVADIFQVPLDLILDISAYKNSQVEFAGVNRTILELQYENYRIWGATAAILYHLAFEIFKSRN
ncbi:MAG: CoA pyrophosphatase [Gammaproteobacteria bacterium]|nr:CoA pyrophosphatase [Gammaproteobacteria bacterium]